MDWLDGSRARPRARSYRRAGARGRFGPASTRPAHGAARRQREVRPLPEHPDCVTGAVERGDPASGPSVILAKFKPDCAVPWHFHTPNETILMVSGAGRFQAKGDKPASLRAGDYAWMPAKHVHTFSTEQGCMMFLIADGAFDIHYVDDKGNETSM